MTQTEKLERYAMILARLLRANEDSADTKFQTLNWQEIEAIERAIASLNFEVFTIRQYQGAVK